MNLNVWGQNAGFFGSSQGGLMNNTSRLEGLTYAQCDEVMNAISSHIQKLKTN